MFVRDVARALEEHGVPYAVVGGLAVNLYGIPRATYDVDIVVPVEASTLAACRRALESIGLRCRLPVVLETLAGESPAALEARNLVAVTFTDSNDPLREVDVLVRTPMPGADLCARARRFEGTELAVNVVALDDLIALKRAAGRSQDLSDLAHLERLVAKGLR